MLTRRNFLQTTGIGAGFALRGYAQQRSSGPARILVDSGRSRAAIDRRLFGSFLEHLGRAVYGGVYEPGSSLSDANGFRKDVAAEIAALNVPVMRYPGGNFVSGYNWLDGVGPKNKRPRVLDRAWNSIETNQFGTNEFVAWCRLVKTDPLMAVNLGTGTPEMAAALVEYCNLDRGTKWSDLRREHGIAEPHRIKSWCLGNEMDGPWQIGHMTAEEYGMKAVDAARQMRTVDRSLELIACGSSSNGMRTYMEWDRVMLEKCYREVDAISLHRYFNNTSETGGDAARYVAMNLSMDQQIEEVAATCDYVRGLLKSPKRLWLSFDEWNVWYRARGGDGNREEAPKLLEEVYNLEDALLVGGLVNSLIRHADRVRVGCLAQIVNVIAPLMTDKEKVIRQTIYYPYAWALKHARGHVADIQVESDSYTVPQLGTVPMLDVTVTADNNTGDRTILVLNRDLTADREAAFEFAGAAPKRVLVCETLTGSDLKAANTLSDPSRVEPSKLEPPKAGAKMTFKLPPRSFTVIRLAT